MIDPIKHKFLRYILFFNLYFAEGLMIAITTVVTALYLREQGISIPITTLIVGIVNIPWILKFIWGPIVDHFIKFGRKTFIIFGGLLSVAAMFLASMVNPGASLIPFGLLIFVSHIGIGFIDVSTDAWAIDISTDKDRGKINGSMFAGQYSAWAIGAGLLPFIGSNFGYGLAYFTNGFIILLLLIFPFIVKETLKFKTRPKIIPIIKKEFKKKTTLLVALFSPLVFMNEGMLSFIMPIFMRDSLGLGDIQIGLIAAILPVTLAIGSIIGGVATDKFGRKRTLYVLLLFSAIFTASLIFASNWWKLSIIYGIIGFLMGGHSTVSCALFMDVTNPRIGATQYGIFTGIANIGLNGGGMITGTMVAILSFSQTFLYAGWVFGPTILVLYFIRLKKDNKKEIK
ncbi:MAG: MFS transporter [Thermoplasmatales archaeon]|nr:MAG: MFS transporter [Thermoplasmatales archaeon]